MIDTYPDVTDRDLLRRASERDPTFIEQVAARTRDRLEQTGRGLDLTGADLSGLDLSELDLRGATLNRAQLYGTKLCGADLSGASLICAGLERANFRDATLYASYLHALAAQVCAFDGADLRGVLDATGSLFHGCSMRAAQLDGARLQGASFYQCDLTGAGLSHAQLQGATINESTLTGIDLQGAELTQLTVTKCALRGANFRGASGVGVVLQRPTSCDGVKFQRAALPRLRLDGWLADELLADDLAAPHADLFRCELPGARLTEARLQGARLVDCCLDEAEMSFAVLSEAAILRSTFRGAALDGVIAENWHAVESTFIGANLREFSGRTAVFRDCNLSGADLSNAYLYRAMLTGDPPAAMALVGATLRGANLVQAYIAADLSKADLTGIKGAYLRLNQSRCQEANFSGAGLYEASMVKTDLAGATLTGVRAPFFADRCPGLEDALRRAVAFDALACVEAGRQVARCGAGGST